MIASLALVALTTLFTPTLAEQVSAATTEAMLEKRGKKQPINPLEWHHAYGWAIYILVGVVLVIGMAGRLASYVSYMVASRKAAANADLPAAAQPAASKSTGIVSRAHTMYRRHIGVPAAFGHKHMNPVGAGMFSVPTRLQAIMIFAFVAINVIFSFTSYDIVEGKTPKSVQLGKQIGDRAGIMAFYNFPLLFALAGRNDILLWLTGWSYRSMNLFHRWVARMAVLHAIVHSAAYTHLNRSKLAAKFQHNYFWGCAIFATVVLSMMIPLSIRPLRAKFYEIFLILHILMALAVLVLLFYHVRVVGGTYNCYLWVCVGIWAFDRLVRFLRVAVLSFRTLKVASKGQNAVARIACQKTGLIRLSVDSSVPLNPSAGSYYFLYTPWSSTPWQSHPFSLASWQPSASGSGTTLNFLIAPRAGATKRLQQRIEKSMTNNAMLGLDSSSVPLRVLLEGPYGVRHPVHKYDHVLLIAGGTGITAMLPYVFELARLGHKHVTLAWIVKDAGYANDVLTRELSVENRGHTNITLFISSAGALVRMDSQDTLRGVVNEKLPAKKVAIIEEEMESTEPDSYEDESADSHTICASPVDSLKMSRSNSTNSHGTPRCLSPVDSIKMSRGRSTGSDGLDRCPSPVDNFKRSRGRSIGARGTPRGLSPVDSFRMSRSNSTNSHGTPRCMSPVNSIKMSRGMSSDSQATAFCSSPVDMLREKQASNFSHLIQPQPALISPLVSAAPTRAGTPCINSPSRPATPFEGVNEKDMLGLKSGDLMAHLVRKKKFLNNYTSNISSTSTACDYDEDDTLAGSSRTEVNKYSSGSLKSGSTSASSGSHRFVQGRPAMRLLIHRAIDRLIGNQRLAVVSCGPWSMMDDLRATVAQSYGTGDHQVPASQLEYFEDAFEW